MVYADYNYYAGTYLGAAIAEEDFFRLIRRASERIDAMTFYRAAAYFEDEADRQPLQNAACAIAEILQQSEIGSTLSGDEEQRARIQTEITGQYHMTYFASLDTATAAGQAAIEQALTQAAKQYLYPTGLLYLGVSRR